MVSWKPLVVVALACATSLQPAAAQLAQVVRPIVTRPDGPVWDVIRKNCTRCHGIDDYAYYNLNKASWQKLIEEKHQTQKVAMAAADVDLLTDWLQSQFGPSYKPFPRAYKPAEITNFLTDVQANDLIDRDCTSCHSRDRIDNSRKPEVGWRVTMLDMRQKGAQITDDELEHLVEWLGRVLGTNRDK